MPSSDQGIFRHRYCLIPRTLIFLTQGDKILLLKGAPDKRLWANLYNGVGGHIKRGEDVLTAARRELKEETGLDFPDLWCCCQITVDTGDDIGIGIFVFRGEIHTHEPPISSEGTLEWIPLNQINDYPLVEDLYTLIPKLMSIDKGDIPFAAHYFYDDEDKLVIRFVE